MPGAAGAYCTSCSSACPTHSGEPVKVLTQRKSSHFDEQRLPGINASSGSAIDFKRRPWQAPSTDMRPSTRNCLSAVPSWYFSVHRSGAGGLFDHLVGAASNPA